MGKIGYARVSTKDQNLGRQLEKLKFAGVTRIFTDKVTGATTNRNGLKEMFSYIREGDIVCVAELDRLGRDNVQITKLMSDINDKGATLEVLNLPTLNGVEDNNLRRLINTLMIELYKYQAEAERKSIRERQRQGIEIAKLTGKYKGRKPLFKQDDTRLQRAFQEFKKGATDSDIEKIYGINRRTFIRYRKKYNVTRK